MSAPHTPKILLIKPALPYPPNQGTKVASFSLIQALHGQFDLTVLACVTSREEAEAVPELKRWCARVVAVTAPHRRSILHRAVYKIVYQIESLLTRRSLKSLYECPREFMRAAGELSRENFDLVIIEYWQLYRLAKLFRVDRCVLLTHDIDMFVNRQATRLETSLPRKIFLLRRWLLEQREEMAAYRSFRKIWALTERDRDTVLRLSSGRARVEVMPVGFNTEVFAPSGMRRNAGEVLFVGHLDASFNQDALEFFVQQVYPLLEGTPGISMTIVGGRLPSSVESFALRPEVEIMGSVPDVKPYLHRARCLVIPLRFGGGLRIRILEAMAAGIPLVCTPVAIAGMPFEPEQHYLLAQTPQEIAAAVRRLLEDESLWQGISERARREVGARYGTDQWRKLTGLVTQFSPSS